MNSPTRHDPRFPPVVVERLKTAGETSVNNAKRATERMSSIQFKDLSERVNRLIHSRDPRWIRLRALYEALAEITVNVAPFAPCRRGCSHCCYTGVRMHPAEARMIASDIGRAVVAKPKSRPTLWKPDAKESPCPFLVNDECSIYEHRPFACRAHYNMDVDSLLCELVAGVSVPVFYWNNTDWWLAYSIICGSRPGHHMEPTADIRDYFPPKQGEG